MKHTHTFNFHDGATVDRDEIAKWHNQVLEHLEKDKTNPIQLIRSGKGMVIGIRHEKAIEILEVPSGYVRHLYEEI